MFYTLIVSNNGTHKKDAIMIILSSVSYQRFCRRGDRVEIRWSFQRCVGALLYAGTVGEKWRFYKEMPFILADQ
jgi:hypothetical protein